MLVMPLVMSGCTAFRALKCGNPSTDTYRNFEVDTVRAGAGNASCLITSEDHDPVLEQMRFTRPQFNNETLDEYFARYRGDGALLVVRNDTILLERYY